jgi:hypothetical protein
MLLGLHGYGIESVSEDRMDRNEDHGNVSYGGVSLFIIS